MLPLDSDHWSELWHVYGKADDVPDQLRALYSTPSTEGFDHLLGRLLTSIYHQHDATTAAFAVAPHLEAIATDHPDYRLACTEAIALIEAARQNAALRRDRAVEIPNSIRETYLATVSRLPKMIGACADQPWETHHRFLFAGMLLAVKGSEGWAEDIMNLGEHSGVSCPECGKFIDFPRRTKRAVK